MPKSIRMAALLIAAGIGAFVLRGLYVAASVQKAAEPAPLERVRVAAADLPEGLLLRDNDLAWQSMPRTQIPAGAFVETQPGADLKGALLRSRVSAGTPLRVDNVIPAGAPDFLAAALKPGMRAISVPIDDVSGNAGLIQPGDYVDVLLTQQIGGNAAASVPLERAIESETVLTRIRVLAVGSEFQRPKASNAAESTARARTVTLEVSPRTAQVVSVATRLGALSLALRSFATSDRRHPAGGEEMEPDTPPVWAGDVSRAFRDSARSQASSRDFARQQLPLQSVVIYRGSSIADSAPAGNTGTPGLPPLPPGLASSGGVAEGATPPRATTQ
ncbi:Flp pilus assembly protein CpaB [Burkholderia sp. ABCPW 111]|uniref:Flp pilus assembly protein CpaB n=1 Tax=Burkholderia sp. ABCPW 111 TaxID=1820025 RepID=UPI0005310388|nr:Flp pilus assembly protein CpaB [Burkholderia sp. ABCPW 111]KGS03134.1 Flp pilus assembly protein CpaB [Burkholderia sp. ABCPW 111]